MQWSGWQHSRCFYYTCEWHCVERDYQEAGLRIESDFNKLPVWSEEVADIQHWWMKHSAHRQEENESQIYYKLYKPAVCMAQHSLVPPFAFKRHSHNGLDSTAVWSWTISTWIQWVYANIQCCLYFFTFKQRTVIDVAPLDFTVRSLCILWQDTGSFCWFGFFCFMKYEGFLPSSVNSQINFPRLEQYPLNVFRIWLCYLLIAS